MKKIIGIFMMSNLLTTTDAQQIYDLSRSPYLETISCTPSFTDAFACALNPAAAAGLKGLTIGGYVERKFLIQGLDIAAVSFQFGSKAKNRRTEMKVVN